MTQFSETCSGPVFIRGVSDWSSGVLASFDTETTGVDVETARIVSASIVIDFPSSDPIVSEWLINPGVPIDLAATAVHGINDEYAQAKGMPADQAISQIVSMLDGLRNPLVTVNAVFDLSIVAREALRYGMDAVPILDQLRIIDTLVCDRMLDMYRPGRRSLTAASAAYGIAIRGAHTATGDVKCAIRLARAMGRKYPSFDSADLDHLMTVQAQAYQDWAQNFEDFRRMDEPGFTVATDWPYRPVLMVEV